MSGADGSVDLAFGGDERRFRLGIAELIALQEKRNSGPMEIAARLQLGVWRVEDVTETLRIGLMGGGTEAKKARELVEATVRPGHITEHVLTARAVLLVALQGLPDDPVGKAPAAPDAPEATAASPQPPSTAPAPLSDLAQPPSIA